MDIGRLNQRITVQQRTLTLDGYGQELNTWTNVATVWANVKPISGREKMRGMAIESQLTHTVLVRYREAFMPPKTVDAYRINYEGRIFNITAARDLEEDREYIIFDCTEGSLDGQ
jgi:SPP1 family predicted phage head-tail adaptor